MNKTNLRFNQLTLIALMSAVICVLSPFRIPLFFTPIPFTLGVFAVLLCAYLLPPVMAFLAVLVYLCIGLAGLPVFSGFQSGFFALTGPTGGYLIGYLPLVWISSYFIHNSKNDILAIFGMILGLLVLYSLGTLWFSFSKSMSILQSLTLTVLPFIPFDLAKIIMAYIVGRSVRARIHFPVSQNS